MTNHRRPIPALLGLSLKADPLVTGDPLKGLVVSRLESCRLAHVVGDQAVRLSQCPDRGPMSGPGVDQKIDHSPKSPVGRSDAIRCQRQHTRGRHD